jgi:cation:H+ antiporter
MDFLSQTDVIILALGTLILGMAILVKGGDLTVDGAVQVARHYGMPPLLVGFTIVAFGTSLPELIASINANLKGAAAISVGGMVGSNISNILFVGGVCAAIYPLRAKLSDLRNDFIMLLIVTVAWAYMLSTMQITAIIGYVSIFLLIAYVAVQYKLADKGIQNAEAITKVEQDLENNVKNIKQAFLFIFLGLIGLAIGAELLIRGAVTTARIVGIQESVIGLTLVALGTSLPELTTCAIAAMKKQGEMIIGNIIGSNIFNLMMVLGGISLIGNYSIYQTEPGLISQDIPIMIGVTLAFIIVLVAFKSIPRWAGVIFTLGYVGYMLLLIQQSMAIAGV